MHATEMVVWAQLRGLLLGISTKYAPEQLPVLFEHPTAKMTTAGRPPVNLLPDDIKALIAYLQSLK